MSALKNYISESEAVQLAGVSGKTLQRFVETGYLQVESDGDGLRLFERSELCRLFGVRDRRPAAKAILQQGSNANTNSSPRPVLSVVASSAAETAPAEEPDSEDLELEPETPNREVSSPLLERLEDEIQRLKLMNQMQERLLEIREGELKELKEQRTWLQQRVERLEDASHRDQMLLMAGSETVRKLIEQKQRSPVRALLQWCGVITPAPETPPKPDIELSASAKSDKP